MSNAHDYQLAIERAIAKIKELTAKQNATGKESIRQYYADEIAVHRTLIESYKEALARERA